MWNLPAMELIPRGYISHLPPRLLGGESKAGAVRRRLYRQVAEVVGRTEPGPILTPLGWKGLGLAGS